MKRQWAVAGMMLSILAFGCSEATKPSVDAEACEHLTEGPYVALLATASADTAPAIAADHQVHVTTLIDVTGDKGGFVKFGAPEAADYLFFFDATVPVQFLDATNVAVAPEESVTNSTTCSRIKVRHLVPLAVGTYGLRFGPTALTAVGIVVEEAAHTSH